MSTDEHQIVAVVSRTIENAKKFASMFEIPKSYGSYDEFASDPEIEVVYIGSVCTEHVRLTIQMLKAGKHVLCEKPFSETADEIKMVNKLAKEKNLFFMEAVWVRCFPIYKKIKEEIESGNIGDPQMVTARLCGNINFDDISLNMLFPAVTGGILLEGGIYTVQFAILVYGEMPVSIKAEGEVNEKGYDIDGCIILTFSRGQKACLMYTSKGVLERNGAIVYGNKGIIEMEETFYCPEEVNMPSGKIIDKIPPGYRPFIWTNAGGLRHEAEEVRRCIRNGELECPHYTHKESEMVHEIMDEVAKQIGRHLPHSVLKS